MTITQSDHAHGHNQGFSSWEVQQIQSNLSFFSKTEFWNRNKSRKKQIKILWLEMTFLTQNLLVFYLRVDMAHNLLRN